MCNRYTMQPLFTNFGVCTPQTKPTSYLRTLSYISLITNSLQENTMNKNLIKTQN